MIRTNKSFLSVGPIASIVVILISNASIIAIFYTIPFSSLIITIFLTFGTAIIFASNIIFMSTTNVVAFFTYSIIIFFLPSMVAIFTLSGAAFMVSGIAIFSAFYVFTSCVILLIIYLNITYLNEKYITAKDFFNSKFYIKQSI